MEAGSARSSDARLTDRLRQERLPALVIGRRLE